MTDSIWDDIPPLLDGRFPLPIDRPFTTRQAVTAGVSRRALGRLLEVDLVRRLLKGVYVAAQVEDSLVLRGRALVLVVPPGAVVTDWTACWYHTGLDLPGDHLRVPPVSMFLLAGHGRLRNSLAASGERALLPEDIMEIDGLRVTVPIRTAWDLGRLSRRDNAIGGMDGLLRLGTFTQDELIDGVKRFRRQRGVVQLRELAPLTDARAESPGESVMRLRWVDTPHLPRARPQTPICDHSGREIYRIDLGVEELKFGAEYDGEKWHSRDKDKDHDKARRAWLDENRGWTIRVLTKKNVFGAEQNASDIFREGIASARRRMGEFKLRD